jgi:hypothetical protein
LSAQLYAGYVRLTDGAGLLNGKGAVDLARYLAASDDDEFPYPGAPEWSGQIIWGNRLFRGGQFTRDASAWSTLVTWGDALTWEGDPVAWGDAWFYTDDAPNVVWGERCGGSNCAGPWTTADNGSAVTGASDDGDTVVWGTSDDGDTVVWGTSDDGDTVVWGTSCSDQSCQPVIWPRQ